jgi:hypothetical protein
LGKSQSKPREQFTKAEDRIKKACETSASHQRIFSKVQFVGVKTSNFSRNFVIDGINPGLAA